MKSLVDMMFGLVSSILTDIAHEYPTMTKDLELDRSRLHAVIHSQGESIFTLVLPSACDWFHQSLAAGFLLEPRPYLMGPKSKGLKQPRFLHGLFSRVFDDHGTLRVNSDPHAVFFIRQILLCCKKWRMDCGQEKVDATLMEFVQVDESLPEPWPHTWDHDDPQWMRRTGHPLWGHEHNASMHSHLLRPKVWDRFSTFCGVVVSAFGPLDVWSIRPKHGPGVVADRARIKFEFEHWPAKLERVFPADWFASHDFVVRSKTDQEFPSRVATVPKTQKGPRVVASEPTSHQWIQGGIQRWFEGAIRRSCLRQSISLHDQNPSRCLALEASKTGSLATVDLSAASDRLSCRLVEYVFQSNVGLLDALHASRTRSYITPLSKDVRRLRKFAPMGSACTFPVQSIVFSIIAAFAVMEHYQVSFSPENVEDTFSQVRVFGDDIIIPSDVYPILESLLSECGLKVNHAKSFFRGNFRESCGMDAYNGVDVTPAYARAGYDSRDPATLASVVECSNNFFKKGLWHAADYWLKTVPVSELSLLPVADVVVGSCTVHTFCKGIFGAAIRINKDLQKDEVLVLDVISTCEKETGTGEASLLQWFTESPSPLTFVKWEHGEAKRPRLRKKKRWVTVD